MALDMKNLTPREVLIALVDFLNAITLFFGFSVGHSSAWHAHHKRVKGWFSIADAFMTYDVRGTLYHRTGIGGVAALGLCHAIECVFLGRESREREKLLLFSLTPDIGLRTFGAYWWPLSREFADKRFQVAAGIWFCLLQEYPAI